MVGMQGRRLLEESLQPEISEDLELHIVWLY